MMPLSLLVRRCRVLDELLLQLHGACRIVLPPVNVDELLLRSRVPGGALEHLLERDLGAREVDRVMGVKVPEAQIHVPLLLGAGKEASQADQGFLRRLPVAQPDTQLRKRRKRAGVVGSLG